MILSQTAFFEVWQNQLNMLFGKDDVRRFQCVQVAQHSCPEWAGWVTKEYGKGSEERAKLINTSGILS